MGFSQQEYWSGLPFPSREDLPRPGVEPGSPALQADPLPSEPPGSGPGNILKMFTYQSKVTSIKIKIIKVNQMPCG